ncbi:MAG TPA: hypothetical protein DCW90_05730 [Lachnospiraceae bacterium]|nr:hypothetical protein [Lachnospiraceae bacterium]
MSENKTKQEQETMNEQFHVAFTEVHNKDTGEKSPIIAVGTMKDKAWDKANEATSEAIEAVRDYFFAQYKDEDKIYGFQWKRADGKVVKLVLTVDENDVTTNETPADEATVHEGTGEIHDTIK